MLMWYFRGWIVQPSTLHFIGSSCILFILYCFVLTQVVDYKDDILNAVVFLTFSALPMVRILYYYYDDHAIDLNDYLYNTSSKMLAKGANWESYEDRWSFAKYPRLLNALLRVDCIGICSMSFL